MKKRLRIISTAVLPAILLLLGLLAIAGFALPRQAQQFPDYASDHASYEFERAAAPGFDAKGRAGLADSAWSMKWFDPPGNTPGYLYVGTDNNILGLSLAVAQGSDLADQVRPPQIRRYRPDLGSEMWEVVLDYADIEEPPYRNQGFRAMEVYDTKPDGRTYLYAATMATESPEVWRSASGDPGDWERVFTFPSDADMPTGSVRGMAVHDGLLYMAVTSPGDILPGGKGQIWATDGVDFFPVITDGFGDPANEGVASIASFNGCLYAGTYNPEHGQEVWKLRCIDSQDAAPQRIIGGDTSYKRLETVMHMHVFNGSLYIGTGIPLGVNPITRHGPRGCQVLRINEDDSVELIVGPESADPLSGYRPGFGWRFNAYCWYLQEYDGYLYVGTWDLTRTVMYLDENPRVTKLMRPLIQYLAVDEDQWGSPVGGDLYRTSDGVHWEPLFLDGLGNGDNHGIRTLEPTPIGLFIGTENPFTRLEVWRLEDKD